MQTLSRRQFASALGLGFLARPAESVAQAVPPVAAPAPGAATPLLGLDSNENPYGPSARALVAMTRSQSGAARYQDAKEVELAEALARLHGVAPDQVVLGCGSGEILKMADAAFLGPGQTVVAAEPTFEAIFDYAQVTRAEGVKVPLTADHRHDLPRMAAACNARTGLVYVCNPNNPTGTIVTGDELRAFLERVPGDTVIVLDEAYHHFVEDKAYRSGFELLPRRENLVLVRTFSKIYGLAGMRLGYAVASPARAKALRAQQVWSNANAGVLEAALTMLAEPEHVERTRLAMNGTKRWLVEELHKEGRRTMPSEANFVMIEVGRDVGPLGEAFLARGLKVGRRFPALPTWLRISIGTDGGDARLPRGPARDRSRPACLTNSVRRLLVLAAAGLLALAGWVWLGLPARGEVRSLVTKNPGRTRLMLQREAEARARGRRARTAQTWVPLSRVSRSLIQAVISSEDQKFFGHEGIDWAAIKESAETNVKKGRAVRGGSTLTQQLAKNLYFGTEKSLVRKLREGVVTGWLEEDLSKVRILTLYLNVIEWGEGIYGCEAAAHEWFGKPCADLTPDEAASLAGMIPNPRRINPRVNAARHERARRRGALAHGPRGIPRQERVRAGPRAASRDRAPGGGWPSRDRRAFPGRTMMPHGMDDLLGSPLGKLLLSGALLALVGPVVVWLFKDTWRELDAEAAVRERALGVPGIEPRAPATLLLAAACLILINYYGDRGLFDRTILPGLRAFAADHPVLPDPAVYAPLYGWLYWGLTRDLFYLLPLVVFSLVFRENPLDLGLRTRGLRDHLWLYLSCLVVMIPVLLVVSRAPDFGAYYPMYPLAGRSWLDFAVWEMVYVSQFLCLEVFFRGFWLRGARSLGSAAIFTMTVPYVMIHFGKPYLESCGALVAGVVLGSLSMKTRSIWAGFALHATVAVLMDLLALHRRGALPALLTATSTSRWAFPPLFPLLGLVWAAAAVALLVLLARRRSSMAA